MLMQFRRFLSSSTLFIHHSHHHLPLNNNNNRNILYSGSLVVHHSSTTNNNTMGRGRGGRGGYDWKKHVRPSADPVVQNEVREAIQNFIDSGSTKEEVRCTDAETKNTYKQYCKQMNVGWAKGSVRGTFKMIKFGSVDPALTLWKKVWCYYFSHYCGVDLVAGAKEKLDINEDNNDVNQSSAKLSAKRIGMDNMDINAVDDTDRDEAAAILRLQQTINDDMDTGDSSNVGEESDNINKLVLDSTDDSFDGKRGWFKVRDLLQSIKANDGVLWEEMCSLGVNNCSERKLEQHMDQVEKFFDLQGRGPNQKIRGKKLRVAIGDDESVHFVDTGDNTHVIEYAKPVKFSDTAAIESLIQLVDKANHSLGVDASSKSDIFDDDNLPFNSFNDSWRRKRKNFDLGERLATDNMDPIYNERKNNLRKRLPAFKAGEDFCNRVFENDVVVLCGATG